MRHLSQRVSGLAFGLCVSGVATAQSFASTLAELGGSQPMAIAAAALAVTLVLTVFFLIRTRLTLARMSRQLLQLQHEVSQRDQTEAVLKEAHEDLESRVRDRTSDLEISYRKLNDVRESLQAANERLDNVARVDDLTGIANRAQFDEMLDTEIKRSVRSRKPVSLMLVELDLFPAYRRTYGRDRADTVVRKVAASLDDTFRRAPDIVARYDDQAFGVIMPETEVRDAMRFAERLRDIVHQLCVPYPESDVADRVTVSIGVATMQPDKLYQADELIDATCNALTSARTAGHNTVEYGSIRPEAETEAG